MFRVFATALVVSLAASAAGGPLAPSPAAPPITAASINDAAPKGANDKDPSPIAKAEVLLRSSAFLAWSNDTNEGAAIDAVLRFIESRDHALRKNDGGSPDALKDPDPLRSRNGAWPGSKRGG